MLTALDVNFLGHPRVIASCLLEGGGSVALVDPGPTTTLPGLRAALAERGRQLADVEDVLLTHIHLDHAGATGAILREHPRVRVHVHERGAPHMIDPTRLMKSASRLYGADMERLWGEMVPVPEANVHALAGGETVRAAGRELRVAYTPGHASHHVSYFDPETRTALVGDTGGVRIGAWSVVLPPTPPPDIDLEAWEASLSAILAWQPDALFLTHFGRFADPVAHVDEFRRWMGELREIAVSVLADGSLDDEGRTNGFVSRLEARIAGRAGADAAAACARAVPFAHCWLGLERYLGRRS
jgi:glyoxylase-like metal-dependent hydrolase (beta-lactamase superfamily II)